MAAERRTSPSFEALRWDLRLHLFRAHALLASPSAEVDAAGPDASAPDGRAGSRRRARRDGPARGRRRKTPRK